MIDCLISVGSNIGPRGPNLRQACDRLARCPRTTLVAVSSWHETRPIGGRTEQGLFLNGAVRLHTELSATELLAYLQQIESQLGRVRLERWGPRTVDLDLLLYGHRRIEQPGLQVPHPRMSFRRFVIEPAVEIAADMWHPTLGWTLAQIATHLREAADYIAITGPAHAGKTVLARQVARQLGLRLVADPLSGDRCPPTGGASGRNAACTLQNELARLQQRADALSVIGVKSGSADAFAAAISDFWFDESLADAWWRLPGRERAIFHQAWLERRRRLVPPKLLVVLDPAAAPNAATHSATALQPATAPPTSFPPSPSGRLLAQGAISTVEGWLTSHERRIWQGSIAPLAGQLGCGPLLWLDARRPEMALSETLAAVEAMRPLAVPAH